VCFSSRAFFGSTRQLAHSAGNVMKKDHDMPMRNELAAPSMRLPKVAPVYREAWAIIAFCFIGLAVSLYFAAQNVALDQVPLLIVQYNLG
jgi:hypothetical protein